MSTSRFPTLCRLQQQKKDNINQLVRKKREIQIQKKEGCCFLHHTKNPTIVCFWRFPCRCWTIRLVCAPIVPDRPLAQTIERIDYPHVDREATVKVVWDDVQLVVKKPMLLLHFLIGGVAAFWLGWFVAAFVAVEGWLPPVWLLTTGVLSVQGTSFGFDGLASGLARNRCLTNQGTLLRVFAVVFLLCVDRERGRGHVILNRKHHVWLEAWDIFSFSLQQATTHTNIAGNNIQSQYIYIPSTTIK